MGMLLYGVCLPLVFFLCGAWFVYLAVRSWHGREPRPSQNYLLAPGSPGVGPFLDRCMLPLGLSLVSLGAMLGTANASAHLRLSNNTIVNALFGVALVASIVFLTLTYSVYRYWKPRRLMPAYVRFEARKGTRT